MEFVSENSVRRSVVSVQPLVVTIFNAAAFKSKNGRVSALCHTLMPFDH